MPSTTLKIGAPAPDFVLPQDENTNVSLSQLRSGYVVLYFYPKDNTPGCTLEGQEFTALKEEFSKVNTFIIGISKDSVASHMKFCEKRNIGITLLSDEMGHTCEDYGVWVEKNMYGKTYMGVERTTFLINKNGEIAHIWTKVRAKEHAQSVLDKVKELLGS